MDPQLVAGMGDDQGRRGAVTVGEDDGSLASILCPWAVFREGSMVARDRAGCQSALLARLLSWAKLRTMTETTGAAEANVLDGTWDRIFDWTRRFGLRPVALGLAGCALEMTPALGPWRDGDRFGAGIPRAGGLLIVAGPVNGKMAPLVRRLWDEMPEPKWALALGAGPDRTYAVARGLDGVIPVDVRIPGWPPRAEDLLQGLRELQEKAGLAEVRP
jgi:NADH-quinone oxidoreductase subunit B